MVWMIRLQKLTCENCGNSYSYAGTTKAIEQISRLLKNKELSCPKCKNKEKIKYELLEMEDYSGTSFDDSTPQETKEYEKRAFKTPSVKKLEKTTMTIMQPYADSEGYHEVTITKNLWKCACGLVWEMRHDAEDCVYRGHKSSYNKIYGGYYNNGRLVGGRVYKISAVRREN
jgi:hypothetical protein